MPRQSPIAASILALGLLGSAALIAGPLNPPGGPVASTYKTLSEVEPRTAINTTNTPGDADSVYRIALPGSYYLTGNISGQLAKAGIEIAAGGVTIDLCGFELVGVAGALDAIATGATGTANITIVNGSIRSWPGDGVDLATNASINARMADLRIRGCSGVGIAAGPDTDITHCLTTGNTLGGINTSICGAVSACTAYANGGTGIFANSGSTVSGCTAYDNTTNGISVAQGCTVSGCTAYSNGGDGLTAISGCTITGCTSRSNVGDGISVTSSGLVHHCTCTFNGSGAGDGAGIHATGSDNRIDENICTSADRGIDVDTLGNFISRNICTANTTANWDIAASNNCLVVNAVAAGVILGNSGGVAPGSTDPNANFTY